MTLEEINLLIAEGDPLIGSDLSAEEILQQLEQQEQVRLRHAHSFLRSPLYKAEHDKNPEEYFRLFSTAAIR